MLACGIHELGGRTADRLRAADSRGSCATRTAAPASCSAPRSGAVTGCGASASSSRSGRARNRSRSARATRRSSGCGAPRRVSACRTSGSRTKAINPTGSFKARGLSAAITRAIAAGTRRFTLPTAGNAGVAASAYAARAGAEVRVFAPDTTPRTHPFPDRGVRGRACPAATDISATAARRAAPGRPSRGRSTSPPCASRTGSRARRRWGSSWRCSWRGRCPTSSSTPRGAAPA